MTVQEEYESREIRKELGSRGSRISGVGRLRTQKLESWEHEKSRMRQLRSPRPKRSNSGARDLEGVIRESEGAREAKKAWECGKSKARQVGNEETWKVESGTSKESDELKSPGEWRSRELRSREHGVLRLRNHRGDSSPHLLHLIS